MGSIAVGEWSHDDVEESAVNGGSHLWLYRNMGEGVLEPDDIVGRQLGRISRMQH